MSRGPVHGQCGTHTAPGAPGLRPSISDYSVYTVSMDFFTCTGVDKGARGAQAPQWPSKKKFLNRGTTGARRLKLKL